MKYFLLFCIKFYKRYFSHLNHGCCRFIPSCSEYAYLSINKFGAFKGTILFLKRFIKCNPFFRNFGFDPVPEKFNFSLFHFPFRISKLLIKLFHAFF